MTVRHSKKSLAEKLGIKQGSKIIILHSPQNYNDTLGRVPENVSAVNELKGPLDFIHFFTKEKKELENVFPILKKELSHDGIIWISWPKGKSGIATDLNENIVREIGLNNQLVDVKVCAIDEKWSGLKFVRRAKSRSREFKPMLKTSADIRKVDYGSGECHRLFLAEFFQFFFTKTFLLNLTIRESGAAFDRSERIRRNIHSVKASSASPNPASS